MKSLRSSFKQHRSRLLWPSCLVLLILLLAGCGGSSGSSTTGAVMKAPAVDQSARSNNDVSNTGSAASNTNGTSSGNSQQPQTPASNGPQYLIKTLKVSMIVNDTRAVASTLQQWISSTDPRSATAGADYELVGNGLYNISLTFSVQASMYPQIFTYLRDYVPKQGGQLQSFSETVQDVTNDYVDTQSRLKNLRIEQQRIQTLLSQAQSLSDTLTIEQKLTDVEGQIESIEEHLSQLTNQVTFYNVAITLQPTETAPPPPPPPGWNVGQVFHDAFSASLVFAQGLANFLIWLFAFSFYLVPAALIIWLIWRVRNRPKHAMPKPKPTNHSESDV
jgi:flagellar biosynthesis chaperone FliJ